MDFKYSRAELIAKKILNECGLDNPTEIPLSEIILGRGAFYEELPLGGKEGEIVSVNNRSLITVNSKISFIGKKRFVAAHELGHYEMHRNIQPIFSDTDEDLINWFKGGSQEKEANEFAAEFLMPSKLFYKECQGKVFGPEIIESLSDKFQVSKTVAILKFLRRGNHPVFIVYCKEGKMKWWKKSEDFYHYSLFEYDTPPPTGTVAYEVFNSGKAYFGEDAQQEIWKSDWFKMKVDEEDTIFYEYCLYARTWGYTISVIWEE